MKYTNATGDAGEHFFAYRIATALRWPCRLLDIDIGLDAQIEVLDEDLNSSGQFLAVQIKATADAFDGRIYIDRRHVEYWQSCETPVLLALVDITAGEVYLQAIDKSGKYVSAPGGDIRFDFDLQRDRLSGTAPIKLQLRLLAYREDLKQIEALFVKVRAFCEQVCRQASLEDQSHMIEDFNHYLELMTRFVGVESWLHEARTLVERIRPAVGACGYEDVLDEFIAASASLVEFADHYCMREHDAEAIQAFENACHASACLLRLKSM